MIDIFKSIKSRSRQFDALTDEAIRILKEGNYPVNPESILDAQETLAIQAGIVPPNWSGFLLCDYCGCMPAGQGIAYKKTNSCSFCHLSEKTEAYTIANANRLQYWKEVRRITPAPEIDISDLTTHNL